MLPIIGFEVDPNWMTVSMTPDSRKQLIQLLQEFGEHGKRRLLRDFQRVAGHLILAFNVFPLLRPGLGLCMGRPLANIISKLSFG